jgi:hypothetical protein
MHFRLERVHYMPTELQTGILYVSEEFSTAAHLCPCGCGAKIRTPLGPTEWTVKDHPAGPSLWPSVGNWQRGCRSHYVIAGGDVVWCDTWSDDDVAAGRAAEEERRRLYYDTRQPKPTARLIRRLWDRLRKVFE